MKLERFPLKDCFGFAKYRYHGIAPNNSLEEILLRKFGGKGSIFANKLLIYRSKYLHVTAPLDGNSLTVTYKVHQGKEMWISRFENALLEFLEETIWEKN
ncbi:MAG: hypothetical protein D6732_13435 [Methanobacteriota archaeon]|nr:MAG: hypothetical protein D6732_13435 [Euryarchaeota archaeon]